MTTENLDERSKILPINLEKNAGPRTIKSQLEMIVDIFDESLDLKSSPERPNANIPQIYQSLQAKLVQDPNFTEIFLNFAPTILSLTLEHVKWACEWPNHAEM